MKNNKITMKEYLVSTIIVTIISGIFIYFFSQSTSPIVEGYYSYDSAIFQVVGKSWIRGIVPYSQCFDHKGPFVFLMNAIGYAFGIGKTGVAIVQWLFGIVTFMFLYKISRLFTNEKMLEQDGADGGLGWTTPIKFKHAIEMSLYDYSDNFLRISAGDTDDFTRIDAFFLKNLIIPSSYLYYLLIKTVRNAKYP